MLNSITIAEHELTNTESSPHGLRFLTEIVPQCRYDQHTIVEVPFNSNRIILPYSSSPLTYGAISHSNSVMSSAVVPRNYYRYRNGNKNVSFWGPHNRPELSLGGRSALSAPDIMFSPTSNGPLPGFWL